MARVFSRKMQNTISAFPGHRQAWPRAHELLPNVQGTEYMDDDEVASWMIDNTDEAHGAKSGPAPSAPELPKALQVQALTLPAAISNERCSIE